MAKKRKRRTPPVLPGLYTEIPPPAEVNAQRDDAMARVAQNAEDHRERFRDDARAHVLSFLAVQGPTSAELLTVACKQAGIVPHDDRAFGPVYNGLFRRGFITKVGSCRRERGHGTSGGTVWGLPDGA